MPNKWGFIGQGAKEIAGALRRGAPSVTKIAETSAEEDLSQEIQQRPEVVDEFEQGTYSPNNPVQRSLMNNMVKRRMDANKLKQQQIASDRRAEAEAKKLNMRELEFKSRQDEQERKLKSQSEYNAFLAANPDATRGERLNVAHRLGLIDAKDSFKFSQKSGTSRSLDDLREIERMKMDERNRGERLKMEGKADFYKKNPTLHPKYKSPTSVPLAKRAPTRDLAQKYYGQAQKLLPMLKSARRNVMNNRYDAFDEQVIRNFGDRLEEINLYNKSINDPNLLIDVTTFFDILDDPVE